jgi:hypothetical protein
VFKNRVLRRISESNTVELEEGWRKLHNEEIYKVFQKSLYRKARYKNHLSLKHCITKMEFKATLARHMC